MGQAESAAQATAIAESAGSNDRNADTVGRHRNQNLIGDVVLADFALLAGAQPLVVVPEVSNRDVGLTRHLGGEGRKSVDGGHAP